MLDHAHQHPGQLLVPWGELVGVWEAVVSAHGCVMLWAATLVAPRYVSCARSLRGLCVPRPAVSVLDHAHQHPGQLLVPWGELVGAWEAAVSVWRQALQGLWAATLVAPRHT